MIHLANNLLNNNGTSLDDFQNVEECKELLYLHLTHLHTKNHNIFSPNVPSGQDLSGVFLSVDAVLRIMNINDNGRFSDEISTFFSNILNLHQEYYQTTKALHQKVPQVILCNSYDDCCKINHMFKKEPYILINKVLKHQIIRPEKKDIESEVRQWYQCNEKTSLTIY